jgi:NTP pyrophosphatase (non-canonical NTP hydrolase)
MSNSILDNIKQDLHAQPDGLMSYRETDALNRLAIIVNNWATSKGWNEGEDSLDKQMGQIALMHSELSECLEFMRKKEQPAMDDHVPELTGVAAELADVLIRIFHFCGKRGIDLGEAVRLKHKYNLNRPYKHGKLA